MLDTSMRDVAARDGAADARLARLAHPVRAALEALGSRIIDEARDRLARRHGAAWDPLDRVVEAFRCGYVTACRERSLDRVAGRVADVALHDRGFAYEGAAMASALLDAMTPWQGRRLSALFELAPGQRYLLYVGAGWAHAQLRRTAPRQFERYDPLLRWLAVDAIGFHDGFIRAAASALPPW